MALPNTGGHRQCPDCQYVHSWTADCCPFCKQRAADKLQALIEKSDRDAGKLTDIDGPIAEQRHTRTFETGASRDVDVDKVDFEAALSPLAFEAMCVYMHHCRKMPDKSLRPPDNWQKGMPLDSYIKSGIRHVMDWWKAHRAHTSREGVVFALCGIMFNVQGYLHEYLKANPGALAEAIKRHPRPGWEPEPEQGCTHSTWLEWPASGNLRCPDCGAERSIENHRDRNGREA